MCEKEFALNRNVVGACGFAISVACAAEIGFCTGDLGILEHGLFFAALSNKIVVIAHNGVHRNAVGT